MRHVGLYRRCKCAAGVSNDNVASRGPLVAKCPTRERERVTRCGQDRAPSAQRDPAQRGYYLDDSGAIYPAPSASFNSRPLHDTIRAAWGLDGVFAGLPATFDRNDLGSIN